MFVVRRCKHLDTCTWCTCPDSKGVFEQLLHGSASCCHLRSACEYLSSYFTNMKLLAMDVVGSYLMKFLRSCWKAYCLICGRKERTGASQQYKVVLKWILTCRQPHHWTCAWTGSWHSRNSEWNSLEDDGSLMKKAQRNRCSAVRRNWLDRWEVDVSGYVFLFCLALAMAAWVSSFLCERVGETVRFALHR